MFLLSRNLMGTRFEIALCDDASEGRLRAAAEEALDEVERLERQLSLYRPDSELSDVNSRAASGWVQVEKRFFRLLQEALYLSYATDGAFDPTLLPLLRAWGFVGARGKMAKDDDVAAARELVGSGRVLLHEESCAVRFDRPGVSLDLGAIGKGYAIDIACDLLTELGIRSAMLHAGTSTVACLGAPPGEDAWSIAVANPQAADSSVAVVRLRDGQSLSVSGVHGKCFTGPDGKVYGHVLDGRLGRPVQGAQLAAIVSSNATWSDALSTALLVQGQDGMPDRAAGAVQGDDDLWEGVSALLVDAAGSVLVSGPAFHLC